MRAGSDFNILPVYTAQFRSCLPYHNHLARCLDSNWWIVTPWVGRVWYICTRATFLDQLHSQVTTQCRRQRVFFFFRLCLCWRRARPSTHSPSMQSGRPGESSSRHRWGKYNSGIGSPKGGVWPAVEWGVWLASAGNEDVIFFLMQERSASFPSKYLQDTFIHSAHDDANSTLVARAWARAGEVFMC